VSRARIGDAIEPLLIAARLVDVGFFDRVWVAVVWSIRPASVIDASAAVFANAGARCGAVRE